MQTTDFFISKWMTTEVENVLLGRWCVRGSNRTASGSPFCFADSTEAKGDPREQQISFRSCLVLLYIDNALEGPLTSGMLLHVDQWLVCHSEAEDRLV